MRLASALHMTRSSLQITQSKASAMVGYEGRAHPGKALRGVHEAVIDEHGAVDRLHCAQQRPHGALQRAHSARLHREQRDDGIAPGVQPRACRSPHRHAQEQHAVPQPRKLPASNG